MAAKPGFPGLSLIIAGMLPFPIFHRLHDVTAPKAIHGDWQTFILVIGYYQLPRLFLATLFYGASTSYNRNV